MSTTSTPPELTRRPSKAPAGVLAGTVNYTQSQIESAVMAMMSRVSFGGGFDAAQAGTIAQLLNPYVNDPVTGIPPGSVLEGNTEFARMVMEKAPVLKTEANDPATRAALARLAEQQNVAGTGAPPPGGWKFINGEWVPSGTGTMNGGGERAASSQAYSREFGSAALNSSYNALLGQGYTKAQLDAVMPHAKALGWRDKEGLGALADAGREYSGMAAELHRARQRGDKAAEEAAKKRI